MGSSLLTGCHQRGLRLNGAGKLPASDGGDRSMNFGDHIETRSELEAEELERHNRVQDALDEKRLKDRH